MAGMPTTAGSRVLADAAVPAASDAACLAGLRAAGAQVVGRTNLHELALGVTGINPWFGTPVNPLDASLVPGGSSSGSLVAEAYRSNQEILERYADRLTPNVAQRLAAGRQVSATAVAAARQAQARWR